MSVVSNFIFSSVRNHDNFTTWSMTIEPTTWKWELLIFQTKPDLFNGLQNTDINFFNVAECKAMRVLPTYGTTNKTKNKPARNSFHFQQPVSELAIYNKHEKLKKHKRATNTHVLLQFS